MIGCSFPEAEQGLNIGRIAGQIAGFPVDGLRRHHQPLLLLRAGGHRPGRPAGHGRLVGHHHRRRDRVDDLRSHGRQPCPRPHPEFTREHADLYTSMGITAENVAKRYDVCREDQDEFAYHPR